MNRTLIAKILLKNKVLNEEELLRIVEQCRRENETLDGFLIKEQFLTENDLLKMIASELGYEYVNNPLSLYNESFSDLITEDYSRKNNVVVLYVENGILYVASNNPTDFEVFEDLTMMTGYDVVPVISATASIQSTITRVYSYDNQENEILSGLELSEEDQALLDRVESAPIVKLVNSVISAAYAEDASDIHIEPEETFSNIRFRIDGELKEYMQIKHEFHDPVITRIKIISEMNIAEKRIPQDGAFSIKLAESRIDMRVATIPTHYGEKVVMRILGNEKSISYEIDSLDIDDDIKAFLKKIITIPNGIILITGPTGSGKTTTLYSMLSELSTPNKSVITIEDPIEKNFEGISQVGINAKAGLTFSKGLRSILRLDPDVIMIGEIRDAETASIAIRAAITGHLVLSTLHTNDALSSVTRLIDMGTESYMVGSSVKAVIAQRLVRKNCPHCKVQRRLSHEDRLLFQDNSILSYYQGKGCERCNNTGYLGRKAVFEVIPIDEHLQGMIAENASYKEMYDYIRSQGTRLLKDDVLRVLKGGDTSVEEARKILFSNDLF
ncbi:GspE/PulE family protein [Erysipelothrix urinaevulpis]|uniref:GspE/PulE family protein n=1 Tax=Erysipelothrix urinaevulpis TaxID=2683717 RepID=UPI00135CE14D|nr:GspE/PulE family protein [Erysipelothrix urinaevulpis]